MLVLRLRLMLALMLMLVLVLVSTPPFALEPAPMSMPLSILNPRASHPKCWPMRL